MKAQATAAALEIERAVEVLFEAESGGKGVAKEVQEEEEDFIAKEKRQEKHRGREKDRARDKEKKRDRRRHEDKTSTKSHSSSSPTSSTPSPGRKGKGRAHHKPKDRTRSTKEKMLGSSYPNTFTTSFATFGHSGSRVPARPHMLGDPDPALDRERERDAGALAKDDVFARRERDRQHARQTEHSHGKHRVSRPFSNLPLPACMTSSLSRHLSLLALLIRFPCLETRHDSRAIDRPADNGVRRRPRPRHRTRTTPGHARAQRQQLVQHLQRDGNDGRQRRRRAPRNIALNCAQITHTRNTTYDTHRFADEPHAPILDIRLRLASRRHHTPFNRHAPSMSPTGVAAPTHTTCYFFSPPARLPLPFSEFSPYHFLARISRTDHACNL